MQKQKSYLEKRLGIVKHILLYSFLMRNFLVFVVFPDKKSVFGPENIFDPKLLIFDQKSDFFWNGAGHMETKSKIFEKNLENCSVIF